MFSHQVLKTHHRNERENFPENLSLRVHRALSWLRRAELENDDFDAKFIFLWIGFNAAYANEFDEKNRFSEQRKFLEFLSKLISLDEGKLLYEIIWENYTGAVRVLIDNPFVFQPFWHHQNQLITEDEWRRLFEHSKASAKRALAKMDTRRVLAVIFERLYVLRNQLLHGGATWDSSVNRDQLRDGVTILEHIVPTIIHLMMKNPKQLWGEPAYPVVK
jgi:hypothetical protein